MPPILEPTPISHLDNLSQLESSPIGDVFRVDHDPAKIKDTHLKLAITKQTHESNNNHVGQIVDFSTPPNHTLDLVRSRVIGKETPNLSCFTVPSIEFIIPLHL